MLKLVTIIFFSVCLLSLCASEDDTDDDETSTVKRSLVHDEKVYFQKSPLEAGDFPVLNRKVFRCMRSSVQEHPYVVSIRRNMAHYVTGTILSKNVILTVAHPIKGVPTHTLNVVVGENYSDRGAGVFNVILVIIHEDFNSYTFQNDVALIKIYEGLTFRVNVKPVIGLLREEYKYKNEKLFITGWGRCDLTGKELCFPRHSVFQPNESLDPMLRTMNLQTNANLMEEACGLYKKLYDITLAPGMVCLGMARRMAPMVQCMAVPGAPAVVDGRLFGISSWGLSCGYEQDLPVIFTDVRYYYNWIYDNLEVFHAIPKSELRPLYKATICYKYKKWLLKSRKYAHSLEHFHDESEEIIPSTLDRSLARLHGDVYDFRNYFNDGKFDKSKKEMYAVLRHIINKTDEISNIIEEQGQPDTKPFLSDYYFDSDYD